MTAVGMELEGQLQSMLEMKPPGANQQKISSITQFCNANIAVSKHPLPESLHSPLTLCLQNESVLVQKIYTHFKKAPENYKLGALYVVDSIARSWLDHAKKASQELGSNAPPGTFAGGVFHIQELLPSLINDISTHAPAEHKVSSEHRLYCSIKLRKAVRLCCLHPAFPSADLSTDHFHRTLYCNIDLRILSYRLRLRN